MRSGRGSPLLVRTSGDSMKKVLGYNGLGSGSQQTWVQMVVLPHLGSVICVSHSTSLSSTSSSVKWVMLENPCTLLNTQLDIR